MMLILSRFEQCHINQEMVKEVGKDLKIVFTPLHGTANISVRLV